MKKFKLPTIFLLLALITALLFPATGASALSEPDISSRAAMVVDLGSGRVYYSKNPDELVYPASTTKIMTVLLAIEAIERGDVSIYDSVTASESMTYDLVEDGSTAGIVVGETMTLEQLLYCAMISSANEACNVIAEYIGGTIPDFIDMMNARAKELGCAYTTFKNTHGLPDEGHHTTPSDYCLIASEAARHDLFMQICNTPSITIAATNKSPERKLSNSNALICQDSIYGGNYLYEPAAGIKTGYTSAAGYCLVSTASRDGIQLLTVVFGGQSTTDDSGVMHYSNFEDSITLYEWVFNNFSFQEILSSVDPVTEVPVTMGSDADSVSLRPESSITALMPNDFDPSAADRQIRIYSEESGEELKAPITSGQVLGEMTVSVDGVSYGTVKLVSTSTVELSHMQYIKSAIVSTLGKTPVKIVIGVLVLLLLVYIALVVRYRVIHVRRKRAAAAARRAKARRESVQAAEPQSPDISYFTSAPAQAEAPSGRPAAPRPVERAAPRPVENTAPTSAERSAAPRPERPAAQRTERSAGERSSVPEPPTSKSASQADRDYFEEFFRQK
jgi:D-alanyl-D-alanine carboxypeptidase (penicillin-binding protein 5/6)